MNAAPMTAALRASTLAAALLAVACGGSDAQPSPAAPTSTAVTINFKAKVSTEVFSCGKTAGYSLGTGAAPWRPKDFRFYVHDLRLVASDATEVPVTLTEETVWQRSGVALLDFEDGTGTCNVGTPDTNTSVRGTVATGSFAGLKFKIGVPAAQNHLDVAAAPPPFNLSAMFWSWTSGYKFMKIDGTVARLNASSTPVDATANFHLGSTGCALATPGVTSTAACTKLNLPEVAFAAFNPATQSVVIDLQKLFVGSNFDMEGGGAPGCMSGETDPECPPIFAAIGLPIAATSSVPQTAFRVE